MFIKEKTGGVYMKKLRASDWLKKSAFSCNTSAKLCKVVTRV